MAGRAAPPPALWARARSGAQVAARAVVLLFALGWVLTLGACAVLADPPMTAALKAAPPPELPLRIERDEVPFFPQTLHHCGPAALATVLADIGLPADLQALADAAYLPLREGSLQADMLGAARRHGAVATRLPRRLDALLQELAEGHAVLVLQNLGLGFAPRWHYAVLVGYDLAAGQVLLRSAATRRLPMAMRTFEHTWARGGHWALVLLPPGRVPATALQPDAVDAALGFERVGPPLQAARAYAAVLQRWPDDLLAAIGLANAWHAAGDTAQAVHVLQQAATRHDSAVAWTNLARLHLLAGDRPEAQRAAERAVRRAAGAEPAWLPAARDALIQARGRAATP